MLRERLSERVFRKPDPPSVSRREFRRQRMRLAAIEHVADRFAFIRRERGDVDQRFHLSARVDPITAPAYA